MRMGFIRYLAMAIITCLAMKNAYADAGEGKMTAGSTGNYLGIQMGETYINASKKMLPDSQGHLVLAKASSNSFGMRVYWGYQFTNYLGLEGGYGYYGDATYKIPNGHSPEIRLQGIDLVGKGIVPLPFDFNIYAKGGAAVMFYKEGGELAPNPNRGATSGSTGYTARPELGVGVGWSFTPNWMLDLSATRITAGGIIPKTSLLALGISYHAVDLYCGQFLC